MANIASIQVGRPEQFSAPGEAKKTWTSAIIKRPVDRPIRVDENGLEGDEQADKEHHGGRDKAVLAYCAEHYQTWNTEYPDYGFAYGGFGENLTVNALDESKICVGDRFQVGQCLLEVSQPRQPCWKLSKRWNFPRLSVLVQQNGRCGWYLRVLTPGHVEPGAAVELDARPFPQFTIAWAHTVMHSAEKNVEDDQLLAACPALSDSWKSTLTKRAHRQRSG